MFIWKDQSALEVTEVCQVMCLVGGYLAFEHFGPIYYSYSWTKCHANGLKFNHIHSNNRLVHMKWNVSRKLSVTWGRAAQGLDSKMALDTPSLLYWHTKPLSCSSVCTLNVYPPESSACGFTEPMSWTLSSEFRTAFATQH